MRDGGAGYDSPSTCIDGALCVGGSVNAAFADNGEAGELFGGLLQKSDIGAVGHAAVDCGTRMRERGGRDVASTGNTSADVLDA